MNPSDQQVSISLADEGDGIWLVWLNRPEARNSIDEGMIDLLEQAIKGPLSAPGTRAIIIAGAGKAFSSGADLNMVRLGLADPYNFFRLHDRLTEIMSDFAKLRAPVIAAINGDAHGGGAELALACDFRVMSSSSKLSFPEARLGIMPGAGGTARLARLIGAQRAMWLLMSGEPIPAPDAQRLGLALDLKPQEEVVPTALTMARQLAQLPEPSVAMVKRAVNGSLDMGLAGAVDYCQFAALMLGGSAAAKTTFAPKSS